MSSIITRVRQPEYTGANRCLPCTVVNILIAIIVAIGIGWFVPVGGVAFFVLALAAIALRGYLVPGTPELTAQYMPDRIHRLFGHGRAVGSGDEDQLEETLTDWDILEPCEQEDDLCLNPNVREPFERLLAEMRDRGIADEELARLFETEPDDITRGRGEPPMIRVSGGTSKWPSTPALMADVAMAEVLSDHTSEWEGLPLQSRGPILAGLRPFLESCPGCEGELEIDEEIVKSCCRQEEVIRLRCTDCTSTIFEVDAVDVPTPEWVG